MIQREFNIQSNDNTLFVTEQCNNHCIMCCQPPTTEDDIDKLFAENIERIKNAPKELPVIGITGGEPTLLGNKLIELVRAIRVYLPDTDIHILSNGRRFSDANFAKSLAEAGEGKLVMGIPLHSDYAPDHDKIAGAKGAFAETMSGLYILAANGICIELRIVINKLNYERLPQMSSFIAKNLYFVGWTAFMGMEYVGYAVAHSKNIWIEPIEYISMLTDAVAELSSWNLYVDIYNIPLCLLPETMHKFAKKSISDWKNKYIDICEGCSLRDDCCGFFATSIDIYKGIRQM